MVAPPSSSSSSSAVSAAGPPSSASRPPTSATSSPLHPQSNYPYHHNHPPKHPFSPPHNPSTISAPQTNRQQHARSYSSTSSAELPMMMKQRHPQQQVSTHGPSHTQKTESQHHRHPQAQHNPAQFPRNDHEHPHAQTRVQAPMHGPAQTHARAASSQQSSRLEPGQEGRRSHSRSHSQTFGPDGHHNNHYGSGPSDSGDYHPLQQPPHHHPHHHGGHHHPQQPSSRSLPQYQENAPGAPRSSRPGPAPASHSTFSTPPSLPSGQTHGGPIRTHSSHHPHPYQIPPAHSLHSRGPSHSSHHQQAPSHQHPNGPPPMYDHSSYGHPNHRYPPMENNGYGRSGPQYPQQMSSRERSAHGYPTNTEGSRPNNASRVIAVDDDEEDEDDGEIKQDSRIQRSGSTAGLAQDGASKKHTQGDHDPADVHKCMDCGKVYKHPNCLWKHRWEHSNYWKSATKFLLSKHQQVRMMEAAAILLGIDSTRESDQDAIVSMVSKQRGAAAQSIGSSSSSSSSPPTSTKSLSTSPPPQNDRLMAGRSGYGSMTMTEAQNNDIQMLTALRNSASKQGGSSVQMPILTSTAAAAPTSTATTATTTTVKTSTSSSSSSSSSPTASKSTSSSNSSTPPTLAPDDDNLPEADEDMAVVSPPNQRGSIASTPTIATVRTMEKGAVTVELGLGMDMELDMEVTRKQQGQQHHPSQGRPSQAPASMEDPHHYQYRGYQPHRESDPYASPQFRKQQ